MRREAVMVLIASVGIAGCAGTEEDLCSAAVEHVKQCSGIELQMPQTCDPDKASLLLSVPCSGLSEARGTYSSWSDGGLFDDFWGPGGGTSFSQGLGDWWSSSDSYGWGDVAAEDCRDLPGYWEGRHDGYGLGLKNGIETGKAQANPWGTAAMGGIVGALLTCAILA